jgi:hypothetical protein
MPVLRTIGSVGRAATRSRRVWLLLTLVVVVDTLAWSRPRNPAGIVPRIIPTPSIHGCRIFSSDLEILVMPADANGKRSFIDDSFQRFGSSFDQAEYLVMGKRRSTEYGLWAPCFTFDSSTISSYDINTFSPAPKAIETAALTWYAAQPGPGFNGYTPAQLVNRLRSGTALTAIHWPGIIHDAVMLPLSLLWLWLPGLWLFKLSELDPRKARRRLRREQGLCETCGYDIHGNNFTRCPECGTELHLPPTSRAAES